MSAAAAFPALGFDPAPGSPPAVDALAAACATALRELSAARGAVLRSGSGGAGWQGAAAEAFRTGTAELSGRSDALVRSVESAGAALRLWHADLVVLQRSARHLEAAAAAARDGLLAAAAHPDLALGGRVFTDPAELAAAEQRLAAAERAVRAGQAELDEVLRRAERVRVQHVDLAADLARALVRAGDLVPAPDLWIVESAIAAADAAGPVVPVALWLRDNAHTIAALADVTGDLSTMLGLTGLGLDATVVGAPAGAVAGTLSGGLSALALAGHLAAGVGGVDVPGETIAFDAAGAATLGLARLSRLGDTVTVGSPSVQAGLEEVTADRAATVFDNIERYWTPRDPLQAWQYSSGGAGALVVPYTNAWRDGRAADERAASEREAR